jgi:uncharacterized protein
MDDLKCPITKDFLVDPVTVPCCGKAFSRASLRECLASNDTTCPACRGDLSNFDVQNVAKNVVLESLVESMCGPNLAAPVEEHQWKCILRPVHRPDSPEEHCQVAELDLRLSKSRFVLRPTLFICVVDVSGSMAGSPWAQVEAALIHMMAISKRNPLLKTVLIRYQSYADIVELDDEDSDETRNLIIKNMFTGGGTNFIHAFEKVQEVLQKFAASDISNVTIIFMTDGQDGSGQPRIHLPNRFRQILEKNWSGPIGVHSVGFGGACDMDLLEKIFQSGNTEGSFRYAEPTDGVDALCSKLQTLFDVVTQNTSVPIDLNFEGLPEIGKISTSFPVDKNRNGCLQMFVPLDSAVVSQEMFVYVDSSLDHTRQVKIEVAQNTAKDGNGFAKYLSHVTDQLASELVELTKRQDYPGGPNVFDLHCGLLQQRIDEILPYDDGGCRDRLQYIRDQVTNLREGSSVNVGKISDMRFSSKFGGNAVQLHASSSAAAATHSGAVAQPAVPEDQKKVAAVREKPVFYSRNNENKNRNDIQRALTNSESNKIQGALEVAFQASTIDDMLYTDVDGNNTLHLVAYCGSNYLMEEILKKFPTLDVNVPNPGKETPVTLAIKKRGFWKTLEILLKYGGAIPGHRKKALEKFAFDEGYDITAQMIAGMGESIKEAEYSMKPSYLKFMYESAMQSSSGDINVESYLNVAMHHEMRDLITDIVTSHKLFPTVDMFLEHCIVSSKLGFSKFITAFDETLLHQVNGQQKEGPLFRAAEAGSLELVEWLVKEKKVAPDQPNHLGNTPLWIACWKRFYKIAETLISHGADVNFANHKGNVPLYGLCQRISSNCASSSPLELAELLVAHGAHVEHLNQNQDSLILMACRNGQQELLNFFLNYVEESFVDYKAPIDGFNAMFAAVEADRPECIRVLHDYGVPLNQKTAADNPILKESTPLHLAAYYNRARAATALLHLGADVLARDETGYTPLHVAVIQEHVDIARMIYRKDKRTAFARDDLNNAPAAYCRNAELRMALVGPCLDALMRLARGHFPSEEVSDACAVLRKHSDVPGIVESKEMVDVMDFDGSTPLMVSAIYSNRKVFETLYYLGADPHHQGLFGVSAMLWVEWIKSRPMMQIVAKSGICANSHLTRAARERLEDARRIPEEAPLLFFGQPPRVMAPRQESGLGLRMGLLESSEFPIPNKADTFDIQAILAQLHWDAKVAAANIIACGNFGHSSQPTPSEICSMFAYTSIPLATQLIYNRQIAEKIFRTDLLLTMLDKLDPYDKETFIGLRHVQRQNYRIGTTVCRNDVFLSASTMWKVATNFVPEFKKSSGKSKGTQQSVYTPRGGTGTVFILKSKTGRYVGPYSPYLYDAEVLFKPGTPFRVTNWYRGGDYIVLGQANIRDYTYKLKPEEVEEMAISQKSLVIEMSEI